MSTRTELSKLLAMLKRRTTVTAKQARDSGIRSPSARARELAEHGVRRVMIPKSDGSLRPLGIPSIRDRVAQMAVKLVIEPIFEADFCPNSYGFRPKKSAHGAVDE